MKNPQNSSIIKKTPRHSELLSEESTSYPTGRFTDSKTNRSESHLPRHSELSEAKNPQDLA